MIRETERVENIHARRRKALPSDDPRRIAMIAAMLAYLIGKVEVLRIAFGVGESMA